MVYIIEIITVIIFTMSSGIFFATKHKSNKIVAAITGLIAILSTLFLFKDNIFHFDSNEKVYSGNNVNTIDPDSSATNALDYGDNNSIYNNLTKNTWCVGPMRSVRFRISNNILQIMPATITEWSNWKGDGSVLFLDQNRMSVKISSTPRYQNFEIGKTFINTINISDPVNGQYSITLC